MPLLAGLALSLVWMLSLAATQLRVVDAARETARAAAREDGSQAAIEAGRKVAPEGARITISQWGPDVVVRVESKVQGPGGLLSFLPSPALRAEAVAVREDA